MHPGNRCVLSGQIANMCVCVAAHEAACRLQNVGTPYPVVSWTVSTGPSCPRPAPLSVFPSHFLPVLFCRYPVAPIISLQATGRRTGSQDCFTEQWTCFCLWTKNLARMRTCPPSNPGIHGPTQSQNPLITPPRLFRSVVLAASVECLTHRPVFVEHILAWGISGHNRQSQTKCHQEKDIAR